MSIEEFCAKHNLALDVRERIDSSVTAPQWYALIHNAAVHLSPGFVRLVHGDGATREDAIRDLERQLAGQELEHWIQELAKWPTTTFVGALKSAWPTIQCPNEWTREEER